MEWMPCGELFRAGYAEGGKGVWVGAWVGGIEEEITVGCSLTLLGSGPLMRPIRVCVCRQEWRR